MSHVPKDSRQDMAAAAFEEGNLFKDIDHTNHGKGSRPYAIDGVKVQITGHLVPVPVFLIQHIRYGPGHIGQEPSGNRSHVVASRQIESARVLAAVTSGKFGLLPTGPRGEEFLELCPVEYSSINGEYEPNYAWRGRWEVA